MKIRVNTHDKQLLKLNAITQNKIKKMSTGKRTAMWIILAGPACFPRLTNQSQSLIIKR